MAAFTALTQAQIAADPTLVSNALLPVSNGITIDPGSVQVVSGTASVGTYDGSLSALGIGAGLIITSGIMPGTTNTSTSFGQNNGMAGNAALDAVVNAVFQTVSLDATTVSFTFTVTDPAITGMSFNVVFGSDEFPEWVNQYVDIGAVFVNGQNVAYFNNNPQAPLSVIGSNLAAGYFQNNADSHLPIEYDGVSAPLTINAPVHLGVNTIMIGIADTRDHILDSGMIISGLQGTNLPVTGVTLTHDGTEGDDVIQGTDAAESINLKGGNDTVDAGKGNDVIVGGLGDDVIMGGGGNDFIDGGAGNDKVVYAFAAADYSVTKMADGSYVVVDLRPGSPDGTDTIVNVETASFSNGIYSLEALSNVANPAVLAISGPVGLSAHEGATFASFNKAALLANTTDSNVLADLKIVEMQTALPAGVAYYETAATLSPGDGYYIPPVTIPAGNFLTIDPTNPAYDHLAAGESMAITITYSVTDGVNTTPTSATFTIIGTNDAPVVSAPVVMAVTEDGATTTVAALANASDVDNGAVLAVTNAPAVVPPTTNTSTGTSGGHGADDAAGATTPPPAFSLANLPAGVSFDAATNSFTIDPTNAAFQSLAAGQTQTVTVNYGVTDGSAVTAASVVFAVTGTNDAPVVSGPLSSLFVNQGSGTASYDLPALLSVASDVDQGSKLTVSIDPAQLPNGVSFIETPEMVVPGYTIPAHVIPAGPRGTSGGAYVYPAQYIPAVVVPDQVTPATKTLTIDSSNPAYASLAQGEELQLVVNYTVSDGTASVPAQAIFTINGMNDAPVVSGPVTASATEGGTTVTVNAFANATDVDHGTILTVVAAPPPPPAAPGADSPKDVIEAAALAAAAPVVSGPFDPSILPAGVSFNAATHSFSIDPTNPAYVHLAAGQTQLVTVNYGVSDGLTTTAASTVFTVIGTNNAPVVSGPVGITVTENGTSAGFQTAVAAAGPGTLSASGHSADDASAATITNTVSLLANATDADGNALSVTDLPTTLPAGLYLTQVPGGYYQPDILTIGIDTNAAVFQSLAAGETTTVTLNYSVTDGTVSVPTTAVFTVIGTNDAPVVAGPATITATEGGAPMVLNALAATTDVDHGAVLTVLNVPTVLPAGVSYDAVTQSFTLDPTNAAYNHLAVGEGQQVSISYSVTDGTATVPATAVFTVLGTNDTPVVGAPVHSVLTASAGPVSVTMPQLLANVTDADTLDVLRVASLDANSAPGVTDVVNSTGYIAIPDPTAYYGYRYVPAPTGHSVSIDTSNSVYRALAAGETMDVAINYTVTDGTATVNDSMSFTVVGVNDAPIITGFAGGTVIEDGAVYTVDALANAIDLDHGSVISVVNVPAILPPGVTYDGATHSFSINPADASFQALMAGETQQVVVTYGVSDGTLTTPTSVVFTVIGTNDAPVITGPMTSTPNEGSGVVSVNAIGNASDPDAHQHSLAVTGIQANLPAGVSFDAVTQRFLFDSSNPAYDSLAKGESLDVVVTYSVTDGIATVPTSVIFSVQGTNDAPLVSGQVQAGNVADNAAPMAINLLANASDVDHGTVLSVATTQGAAITTTVTGAAWTAPIAFTQANGVLSLDPAQFNALGAGERLDIVFNYTITDGNPNGGVAASAHVTIIGQNSAPTGINITQAHVAENSVAGTVVGQLSALDPDRTDSFTYQVINDPAGFFAVSGNKLVVAAGAAIDYETQTSDSIQVRVTDAAGVSFTQSMTIAIDNVLGVTINGTSGNDTYDATHGNPAPTMEGDTINGNGGNDTIDGLAGNDIIDGGKGLDTIFGGAGDDIINGGQDGDVINAGAGNDRILISQDEALNDIFNGGSGTDTLVAVAGKQLTLNGFDATATSMEVWEGNGLGVVGTSAGQTFDFSGLTAVTNMGIVDAADGADTMIGSNFADNFRGGAANDILRGNAGNDILDGGAGNDTINGGTGSDVLTGGANNDTFVFNKPAAGSGVDSITDFVTGTDKIALVGADFGLAAGPIAAGDFVLGTAANAAHQQFIYDAGSKTLFWDADGTGATAAVALTTFTTAANVHLADLLVV